jgi:hypothetical protein
MSPSCEHYAMRWSIDKCSSSATQFQFRGASTRHLFMWETGSKGQAPPWTMGVQRESEISLGHGGVGGAGTLS